jgi:hypothetical protein
MSTEKYVVKQPTFMGSIRSVDRVWRCGGMVLEPDKSVRAIVTAADSPQEEPRETRRHVWHVQFWTTGDKNKTFAITASLILFKLH